MASDSKSKDHILLIKIKKLSNIIPKGHGSQGRVLKIVTSHDGISQKDLGRIMDIQPGSLSELIAKLEKSGLIHKEPDDNDKRLQMVYATDAGRKAFNDIKSEGAEEGKDFFDMLEESEKDTLLALLDKILKVKGKPEKREARLKNNN
mgnify:CR=1 FL=1